MSETEAFVTRLHQIVAYPSLHEENSVKAIVLFDLFRQRLYSRFNIQPSRRPAFSSKQQADMTLGELRQVVLRTEVATEGDAQLVFTTVRHRIDMARRILATRIAREPPANPRPMTEQGVAVGDRELISGIRQRALRHRKIDLNSLDAISQSRELLGERPPKAKLSPHEKAEPPPSSTPRSP